MSTWPRSGEQEFRLVPERLDEGKDVVPAAAVEAGHVVAQLVDDLVHLEGGGQRLDQHRRLDGADGDAQRLLGPGEDLVPQTRLEIALELGQVEIGAGAARDQRLGVDEDIEAEIEQAAGDRLAVDDQMVLRQMPAARAHQEDGRLGGELVFLAAHRVGEVDLVGPAVLEVDLALDLVGPGRRVGVLEIRHEDLGAGIQRIDHHLAVGRPGDLDPPVQQVGGDRRDFPVAVAHMLRSRAGNPAGRRHRGGPGARRGGSRGAEARRVELAVQAGEEGQRLVARESPHSAGPTRPGFQRPAPWTSARRPTFLAFRSHLLRPLLWHSLGPERTRLAGVCRRLRPRALQPCGILPICVARGGDRHGDGQRFHTADHHDFRPFQDLCVRIRGPERHRPRNPPRRDLRAARPQRRRQDHPHQRHLRPVDADGRHGRRRRPRHHRATSARRGR